MKENIFIKTDYSLLKSLIKIEDLILYAKENKYTTIGIIDDDLSSSAEFLKETLKNNIKPVIGLDTFLNEERIILYAKNNEGLKSLFKINTYILNNKLNVLKLSKYISNLIILLPYKSAHLYKELTKITDKIYIGYKTKEEKTNSSLITKNIIPFETVKSLNKEDQKYLNTLNAINEGKMLYEIEKVNYEDNYIKPLDLSLITNQINITKEKYNNLIPHYDDNIKDSDTFLRDLSIKGLYKRLGGNVPDIYKERLLYELKVIKEMNYTDYFLIVYDYVLFAVKNKIIVGPGRGSAAGSLVTYCLGITSVDPVKYGLLFERFLNPDRITMPDIDIDFDAKRRDEVVNYVKEKYGNEKVMNIMTYGTLAAKQVLISVSKIHDINMPDLLKLIDPKKTLKENLNEKVIKLINSNLDYKNIYYEAMKLEGLKKHISTHAAGVVVSKYDLDDIIPINKSGDVYLTGYTMNYLEDLGLLKMDFLAIKDLTIISDTLDKIDEKININKIDLNDDEVLKVFRNGSTTGIFQFESEGIRNFLRNLKPNSFMDIAVALALYRPGPAQNIPSFIKRREKKEKIDYIHPDLEDILKETYGIIVYQEQIIQILTKVGNYKPSEADLIRRAVSKMQKEVILKEKEIFIKKAINNNYDEKTATLIYDLILRFANYGFNKSHSVAYAMVGYQMMYLKVKYSKEFYLALLNSNMGSSSKTKEYIDEAKLLGLNILKPNINLSEINYNLKEEIIMPLSLIKNIGISASEEIIKERENGVFTSYFDFVSRVYGKSVNIKTIENLIFGGALDLFNETRKTLTENINSAIIYSELRGGLDSSLVSVPNLDRYDEYDLITLMEKEMELYGFYVSNHPSNKFNTPKIKDISAYFDKYITTVVLLEKTNQITTKKGDSMAFLEASDETGKLDYVLFPKKIDYINRVKKGDLLKIEGKVEKRMEKYQIVVNKIEIINIKGEI